MKDKMVNIVGEEDLVYQCKEVEYDKINRIELDDWDKVQAVLKILLDNKYVASVAKCESTYIIEYDWGNPDWSSRRLMWLEDADAE